MKSSSSSTDSNPAASRNPESGFNISGLFNLLIVYAVWGSTYLAIRVAVRPGAGIPPFTLGMVRLFVAGVILLTWAKLKGNRIRVTRTEAVVLAGSGLLMWTVGNGLVIWAEQWVDSSLAALLIATVPLWSALIEALLDRRLPTPQLILSLFIGFSGVALLSAPSLQWSNQVYVLPIIALIIAPASWAAGSVLQSRRAISLSPQTSSATQQLFAALGFAVLVLITSEPRPTPTQEAMFAWIYLALFGSVIAFTAYVNALQLLPLSVVMTHAYVNPVIAVVLGVAILGEDIPPVILAGAGLVLLGVAGVFRDRLRHSKKRGQTTVEP